MMFDKTKIDEHIFRFLENLASEEEQAELLHWVKATPENKQYYIEQVNLYKQLNAESLAVDANAAFLKINPRNTSGKADSKQVSVLKKSASMPIAMKIATISLIAVIVSAVLLFMNDAGNKTPEVHNFFAGDTILETNLPDSSALTLNSNVKAMFFVNDTARVLSLSGDAYVEVAPDSIRPFFVSQNGISLKTMGKKINMLCDPQLNRAEITVLEGEAELFDSVAMHRAILKEKEQYSRGEKALPTKTAVKTSNSIAWKTGVLHFDNTPLSIAIPEIETFYKKEITVQDSSILHCKLNAKLDRYGFDDVLTMFELAFGFSVETGKDTIVLSGTGCLKE